MATWLLIASNAAAILTALAALYTVLEMRRQRITSYKPDLVVEPASFYLYWNGRRGSIPLTYSYKGPDAREPVERSEKSSRRFGLNCYNIGLGSAKLVKAHWEVDVLEFARSVVSADPEGIKVWHEGDTVQIESDDLELRATHILPNQLVRSLNHMLPASVSERPTFLNLPLVYLDLYAAHIYSTARWIGAKADVRPTIGHGEPPPSLRLRLTYQSLEGEGYEQKFVVEPTFYVLTAPPKNGDWGEAAEWRVLCSTCIARNSSLQANKTLQCLAPFTFSVYVTPPN